MGALNLTPAQLDALRSAIVLAEAEWEDQPGRLKILNRAWDKVVAAMELEKNR